MQIIVIVDALTERVKRWGYSNIIAPAVPVIEVAYYLEDFPGTLPSIPGPKLPPIPA